MSLLYKLTSNKAKIVKAFKDPLFGLGLILNQVAPLIKNDELFLKWKYYTVFHRFPNLKNPQTFNEKLQWLKIYDHKPEYSQMVDKADAKEYVANIIGEEYIIPTYGVWEKFDDIDFSKLPDQFVLKCTHDSGGYYICRDKKELDIEKARKKIEYGLGKSAYWATREWPYKNVKPRIIAEAFMTDGKGLEGLSDYKFFCFDGYVHSVMLCLDRHLGDTKFYFFDKDWNLLRLNKRGTAAPKDFTLPKPQNIDRMFELASVLSKGHKFLRVDLYNCEGNIYFGELTFFPDSGFDANITKEADNIFGNLLKL